MAAKDLRGFGKKLRQLRKEAGFYQEELAERLSLRYAKNAAGVEFRVDGNRISKWERAFKDRAGREWQPKRQIVLYLIGIFADQLTPEAARTWASQAGYQLSHDDLQKIFSASPSPFLEHLPPMGASQSNFSRLRLPPERRLFGIGQKQQQLHRLLEEEGAPWLIAIDGIGGIGKTSLAGALVREIMSTGRFYDLIWVSAKQEELLPGADIRFIEQPVLDTTTLTDALLEQLGNNIPLARSAEEKLAILTALLKKHPTLIVIDNLETIADYQALLPLLRRLANPGKILLTSRYSLRACADVFCLGLTELDRGNTLAFLRYEAKIRGIPALLKASPSQLENIYQIVGGNPLALKLVAGQLSVLPLSQVLVNLIQARGKRTEALYTYIYWQVWHTLNAVGQKVLLVMPLAQDGPFAQLLALTELEEDVLNDALENLTRFSLVEANGSLEERRYRIHRLTETFLLTEVIKWQSSP